MNAEKYRRAASSAVEEINSRGKLAIVVGGSGLYIKALTHGLAPLPESDPKLREKLNAMSLDDLRSQLVELDPRNGAKDRSQKSPTRRSRSGDLSRSPENCFCATHNGLATQERRLQSALSDRSRPSEQRNRIAHALQAFSFFATAKSFTNESISEWK